MAADQPNVLLILADEHRFDCLGAYGNAQIRTPHLDGLAADGVRYDSCFCPYPVCTPSRYSLLSGLYVHEHRGWSNHSTPEPTAPMFPAILRQAGYATAAVGKMHFTPTYLDVGFDHMVLAEQHGPGRWDDDYHRDLRRLGLADVNDLEDQVEEHRPQAPPEYWRWCGARLSSLPEEHHSTSWIGRRATEALETWTGPGHLLMVGFIKPHHPFDPPQRWAAMYDPDRIDLLAGWTDRVSPTDRRMLGRFFNYEEMTETVLRRVTAYYYASISHMDHQVGRMIELLKRRGLYDDTLIVYTADHGDYMGFHHMLLKGGLMYDPLVKVPLIVKYPSGRGGRGSPGHADKRLVSLVDLAPTILAQAGLAAPPRMTGLELTNPNARRDLVFAETRNQLMARSPTHKWIGLADKTSLLFDLSADPMELRDLAGEPVAADLATRMGRAAEEWRGPDESPLYLDETAPRINQPNVPPLDDDHRQEMMEYFRGMMPPIGSGAART